MKRDTMIAWVQCCSHCGYCSDKIDDTRGAERRAMVEQSNYQEQFKSKNYPQLANRFLCYSIILGRSILLFLELSVSFHQRIRCRLEQEGKFAGAAWQALRGAWSCDDSAMTEGAKQCRIRVAQLIDRTRSANLEFCQQRGLDRCIEADALRRASEFQRAKEVLQHLQVEGNESMHAHARVQLYSSCLGR